MLTKFIMVIILQYMHISKHYALRLKLTGINYTSVCESISSSVLGLLYGPTFELWYWTRLESPLDSREIKPINPEGNQP